MFQVLLSETILSSNYSRKVGIRPEPVERRRRRFDREPPADATLKVYLTASAEERAKRRHKQLKDKGLDVSLAALSRDIEDRDRRDSERTVAPLRPAVDARFLDSTGQSIEEVTQHVLDWFAEL